VAEIQAFGFRNGCADTVFDDGVRLRVYPVDLEDPIEIRACVLNDSNVISIATRDLFWSTGGKQVDLAARLEAAVEAERQVYRAYRARRIEEAVWQEKFRLFWKVMIRSRNILGVLAVGALPSVDVLEDKGLLDLV
jgi:hypothetical protein